MLASPTMNSLNDYPPVKEEAVCWTEKEALGLNIVLKEEKEHFRVKEEEEAVTLNKEDDDLLGNEGKEEETEDLINTSEYSLKNTARNSAVVELMCDFKAKGSLH